jgi:hypothetical protein
MGEHNGFFDGLIRGEQPSSNQNPRFGRIPNDETDAVDEVMDLIRHVQYEVDMAMLCVRNVLRWHGGETIRNRLSSLDKDRLAKIEAIAGPEIPEADDEEVRD